ncbi:YlzJ-like family protein [Paenibacillus thermoaerophilus]|uniref:YlzJ-like family protein n=1 Tax=Paenibacillus thermoaerophilus TaxID=1215385 RepID=A0ABW2V668_9BACL|nr:YlzJ-like family protein [Paenibacillus thermoaerophilus]TMV13852.1 hypothetical protein FE781_11695 [Paenibacillus thermoaerophilus]
MIYSIVPDEVIYGGTSGGHGEERLTRTVEMDLEGIRMEVELLDASQARIVRLLSPDPYVYLNPSLAPGTIIPLTPQWPAG